MKRPTKGYHLPVMFALFAGFFCAMIYFDLRTGEIWRGGIQPTIRLADSAREFYMMISFFSVMAMIFIGGVVWTVYLLIKERRQ